jgi:hypothetical protein
MDIPFAPDFFNLGPLLDDNFDRHYKKIQSFRNQYLNMVRTLLKNKSTLSMEEFMTYLNIEEKMLALRRDISRLNTMKLKKIHADEDIADLKITYTLKSFLPLMIMYYNQIDDDKISKYIDILKQLNKKQNKKVDNSLEKAFKEWEENEKEYKLLIEINNNIPLD